MFYQVLLYQGSGRGGGRGPEGGAALSVGMVHIEILAYEHHLQDEQILHASRARQRGDAVPPKAQAGRCKGGRFGRQRGAAGRCKGGRFGRQRGAARRCKGGRFGRQQRGGRA
eukprot:3471738-Pyramimonas_sp.AAC.1